VQRELQDPAEYAELWLRDSGDHNSPRYIERYQAYLDYFAANRIEGVAFGWIILHNSGADVPTVRLEELTRPIEQPLGAYVPEWFARHEFLTDTDDEELLGAALSVAPGVVLEQSAQLGEQGWAPSATRLRQTGGLRASGEIDPVGIAVVGAADGERPLGDLLDAIAGQFGIEPADLRSGALDAVRSLIEEGFLTVR
jgi:hypothetical protein